LPTLFFFDSWPGVRCRVLEDWQRCHFDSTQANRERLTTSAWRI